MPNDVEDAFEYVNNVQTYILRIYGPLINGQKARVDITGIKPFFDVAVPDNEPLSIFKPRLEKVYIRIITWNHYDRRQILRKVRRYEMETALDDNTSKHYHRKITREKKLPLSERAILSGYNYNSDTGSPHYSYSFRVSVDNYQSLGENKPDDQVITETLSHDHTLVLTWNIETYSTRKMGDLPNAKNNEDRVFMICITIHWKDDPKPLKRICLVDVETKSDPS
ncbi:hypothetical protein Glove_283g177 [Diversispora epigaea]|uniref:DNA-directed DNA polymerase family B exonuclease domain-containing protein n=1 Tax=Diversispora epigaea TaxID=1348612 RepID=A0A397I5I1_9GLOM|nr:hypothetical protein Glove_283g177 [Diversispora epigaea]